MLVGYLLGRNVYSGLLSRHRKLRIIKKYVYVKKKKKTDQEFPGGVVVKDWVLSSLLWPGFSPWPGNSCLTQGQPKK